MNRRIGIILLSFALTALELYAAQLTPAQAKDHVGETATVCGLVASTRYAPASNGQPTFLNLERAYPNQIFTVVIWGRNRAKFRQPDREYDGKKICVTGRIESYRGTPQIEATTPTQIRLPQ